jgi:hypothetical protein
VAAGHPCARGDDEVFTVTVKMVRSSIGTGRFAAGAIVASLVLVGTAQAEPGDHVRIGEAELIPKLVLGSHYRTNVYLMESSEQGGVALMLQPSGELKLDGQDVKLDLGAGYNLRKYLDSDLANLDRFRDGTFKLDLGLLPKSMIGFDLDENLVSSSRESEAWYEENNALITHLTNDLSGALAFHPGGALEADAGGHFVYDDYNVPDEANVASDANYNSRIAYGPAAHFKWRFFPRTAVLVDASMDWFKWNNNLVNIQSGAGQTTTEFGSYLGLPDGTLWKVSGGLRGRFTERIALGLVVGYNKATYDEQTVIDDGADEPLAAGDLDAASSGFDADSAGLDNLLAAASVEYSMSETHRIVLGYDRALNDSYFTNYMLHNYLFLRYHVLLGTRLGVAAEGGFRAESFRGEVERTDMVVRARVNGTYAANEWLAVGAGAWWDRRVSADGIADIEYDDVTANINLTFTY